MVGRQKGCIAWNKGTGWKNETHLCTACGKAINGACHQNSLCRGCYLRRARPNKVIREIRMQLAFIRRELNLRWLYEKYDD